MEFLTIDFEVASRYEYSPCSVAIYKFTEDSCTKVYSTLINSGDVFFDPQLVKLHGITEDMVKNAPSIYNVLNDICKIIKDKFIFAHNATYDILKIIKGCNEYNIDIPNFKYADSLMIAKRSWKGLINYKLDTISESLNIELKHHNADSDAIACGKIVLEALKYNNSEIAQSLLEERNFEVDCVYDGAQAVERIKNTEPGTYDVILMDIMMVTLFIKVFLINLVKIAILNQTMQKLKKLI